MADVSTRIAPELACPLCGGALGDDLACADHGRVATRSADGIYAFAASDDYWGELPRARMRAILDAARRDGWQAALRAELAPEHPDLVPYVQHPARGDWQVLLTLDRERTVAVDVGAGWGANSFALVPNVLRVYAVEKIAERIEFIALRARDDAPASLVPVRADMHALPFAPGSIDVFVVNGVLEWAGLADPQARPGRRPRPPQALQETFLRQLARLLRPGGQVYVGIENRFGQMFWRGTPDHLGLRYTSLMPRPVARAYTYLRAVTSGRTHTAVRDYRTYTYSLRGYRRLLERCGFEAVQAYAVRPGYNVPTVLVPLASTGPMRYFAARSRSPRRLLGPVRRTARRLLAVTGLEAATASCFAFVARRSAGVRT